MNRTLALLAFLVLLAGGAELGLVHALKPLDNRLLDAFVKRQAAKLAPDPDIVLVDIDERSLAAMQEEAGRFPWPREVYADLVQGLEAQNPRAVVFDILFLEPDRFRPQSDRAFIETASRFSNLYFPLVRLDARDDVRGAPAAELAPLLGLVRGPRADPHARIAVIPPLVLPPELWRTGSINFLPDADGVGRRYYLRHRVSGWDLPALPARVAMDLGFPVPDAEDLLLAWRGKAGALPRVSFSDLYQDFARLRRTRAADEFRGKIVVIGVSAAGLGDLRVTPLSHTQPGAEILATAIENLKNGRAMRQASAWWPAGLGVALLVLLYLAFHHRLDARLTGALLAAASAALLFASFAASGALVLLPPLAPLVAAWTFYAAATIAEALRERASRRAAMAQFSRFTNPHVARQLVERGGIETGRREVTLLFSDIRNFTTLSETRSPEEVIALLNRYFSLQADVVFRHGGSLDKFIGDCIMAIWGAPLDDAQHARRAVACALDMAEALEAFKREVGAEHTDFDVGIGLHSGMAVVGLMGSERRLEYTAIGDTVNLASRIEGLTKEAQRRILVSRETMERCADAFDFVSCGTFSVKGRAQPVELFEPRRKT
ncbi:MAG TPA: adenylate/guanylate cyclase domain-containing protein [Burkholderiales bacterium]|nr:adenylate/guanylate cyclase domain-containing protein [Burkholderiales bacterium]